MSTENQQQNNNTGGEPIPDKNTVQQVYPKRIGEKKYGHPYKKGCKCARCVRIAQMEEEVIKDFLITLPRDRVLLILADHTIEAIKRKLPELAQKFNLPAEVTAEDYTRFINEISNDSIIQYTETL